MGLTSSFPSDFFSDVTKGFYGVVKPSDSEALWEEFLAKQGVSQVDDTTKSRAAYVAFLSQKIDSANYSSGINALSPQETIARHMVATVFDLLLVMLNSLTVEQLRNSAAAEILNKKGREYVELLKRVPTYVGSGYLSRNLVDLFKMSDSDAIGNTNLLNSRAISDTDSEYFTPVHASTVASEYTLGYAGITLQDVFEYLVDDIQNKLQQNPPVTSDIFSLQSAEYPTTELSSAGDPYEVKKVRNICDIGIEKAPDSNDYILKVSFRSTDSSSNTFYSRQVSTTVPSTDRANVLTVFNDIFQQVYADANARQLVGATPTSVSDYERWMLSMSQNVHDDAGYALMLRWRDLKIAWPRGVLLASSQDFSSDSNLKTKIPTLINTKSNERSAKNQQIGAYIEAIKGRRDTLKDKADQTGQIGESGRTSRKQTVSFLQALMRQLQNMISSIFR